MRKYKLRYKFRNIFAIGRKKLFPSAFIFLSVEEAMHRMEKPVSQYVIGSDNTCTTFLYIIHSSSYKLKQTLVEQATLN